MTQVQTLPFYISIYTVHTHTHTHTELYVPSVSQVAESERNLASMSRSAEIFFGEIIPEVLVAQASSRGLSAADLRVD